MTSASGAVDPFVVHRSLLFTVAYELLGSAADAEDVLQESWLRWASVDQSQVNDPRAYLVRIVTRQALNHLRTLARRRETYVGEWLPEPLLTSPDIADDVELAENVSIAMLTVLETLGPAERAVFVLREVFDMPYDEIAEVVDKSPVAVRQIAHRAKDHVSARRPRVRVVRSEHAEVVDRLVRALNTGDLQGLVDILAPDVVFLGDGGGVVQALPRPVVGAEKVARLLALAVERLAEGSLETTQINGQPALVLRFTDEVDTVTVLHVEDGKIAGLYAVRNPAKLSHLTDETFLTR